MKKDCGLCKHYGHGCQYHPDDVPPGSSKKRGRRAQAHRVEGQKKAFLAAYTETATIRHAAEAAKVKRSRHYEWLRDDADYAKRFRAAEHEAIELMEREARRRAIEGTEEPTGWYKGRPGGYVRKYSDVLLIFLLKSARPEKYREQLEVVRTQVREREMGRVLQALEDAGVTDEQLATARAILLADDAQEYVPMKEIGGAGDGSSSVH